MTQTISYWTHPSQTWFPMSIGLDGFSSWWSASNMGCVSLAQMSTMSAIMHFSPILTWLDAPMQTIYRLPPPLAVVSLPIEIEQSLPMQMIVVLCNKHPLDMRTSQLFPTIWMDEWEKSHVSLKSMELFSPCINARDRLQRPAIERLFPFPIILNLLFLSWQERLILLPFWHLEYNKE